LIFLFAASYCQAAAEAASAAAAAAASRPPTVGESDEDGQPRVTYIPAALIHTINDEWQFENSHTTGTSVG
jgi:hypothetical protein